MREKNILWISLHGAEKLCFISFGYANINGLMILTMIIQIIIYNTA